MKFSTTLIALVAAGLANAQLPNVPSCSLSCFVSALTTDGCTSLTDFACHCQKPSLVGTVTPCVQKACDVADQISVSNAVVQQCSSAGHPISVPPVETSSSSSSSSASATETSSSASATGSSSSSSAAASTPAASGSTPAGSGSTPAATSTPAASKTSGSASGAASPTFNGAVANIKGNMAGVAAIAAAAAYIL